VLIIREPEEKVDFLPGNVSSGGSERSAGEQGPAEVEPP